MEINDAEYEDIDFDQPPKPARKNRYTPTYPQPTQPAPHPPPTAGPVAPPRTVSRFPDRKTPEPLGDNKPAVAAKPKRPLPPPKPSSPTPHPQLAQSQSVNVPSLPPKPKTSPVKSSSLDTGSSSVHSPLLRRSVLLQDLGQMPGEQMTLSEFVRDHSQDLPLRVRVDEGFCGTDERFIISTGDVYNLHFLKNVKVASITDVGGVHFSVPLNSSIKFGLLYNPENNFQKSVKGYTFDNISALVASKMPPKLIYSTSECLCTDPRSSVEANEILLIKKVGKTPLRRRAYVKAVNVQTKQEKTLYDDCQGNFTTNPSLLQLFLPELLEHLGDNLPIQAMLYITSEAQDDSEFPLDLTTEMVTLTHTSIETSIVATTYWGEDDTDLNEEDFTPIAIPIELEIEVTVLSEQSEDEDLYSNTRDLFKSFDPSKIKDMAEAKTDRVAQSRLYKNVRKGYELDGMQLQAPSRIYDVIGPSPILPRPNTESVGIVPPALPIHPRINPLPSQAPQPHAVTSLQPPSSQPASRLRKTTSDSAVSDSSNQRSYYKELKSGWLPPLSSPKLEENGIAVPAPLSDRAPLKKPEGSVETQIADLHSNTRALKCLLDAMQDNSGKITHDLKTELKRLGRIVDNLSRNYERLEGQVQELRGGVKSDGVVYGNVPQSTNPASPVQKTVKEELRSASPVGKPQTPVRKTADPELKSQNTEELASMDCQEVSALLSALNMNQYREVFETEQVDGEILLECDEEVLRAELNVTSLIHRKKLMSIINGSQSPVSVIQNSNYSGSDVSR